MKCALAPHITLAMLAQAFLAVARHQAAQRGSGIERGLPRRGGRADTDDGARGAPIALPAGLDATSRWIWCWPGLGGDADIRPDMSLSTASNFWPCARY